MEETYEYALPLQQDHPIVLPSDPEQYDGNTSAPYYLVEPAKTVDHYFSKVKALTSNNRTTVGSKIKGYRKIAIEHVDWQANPRERKIATGMISDRKAIEEIVALINSNQKLSPIVPTCLLSHHFEFTDDHGKLLGRVSLCAGNKLPKKHPGTFTTVDSTGKMIEKFGLIIEEAPKLSEILRINL